MALEMTGSEVGWPEMDTDWWSWGRKEKEAEERDAGPRLFPVSELTSTFETQGGEARLPVSLREVAWGGRELFRTAMIWTFSLEADDRMVDVGEDTDEDRVRDVDGGDDAIARLKIKK